MTLPLRYPSRGRALVATALLFLVAGCESDRSERAAGPGGHHAKPPPPLAGKEMFFAGRIAVEIQTGAGFGDAGKADEAAPSGGGHRGGGGGMHMGGGGGRHGGGGGGGRNGPDSSPSIADTIEQDQISNIRRAAANGGPAVMIHLRFTNTGATHADLLVTDFLSELGNFVVQPDHVALEPGQTVEVDPMTSRLAGEVAQAEITLTLRLEGHSEKKVITLVLVPPPPPATDAAPGSLAAPPAVAPPTRN